MFTLGSMKVHNLGLAFKGAALPSPRTFHACMGFYKCINGYVCIKNVSKFGRSKISQSVRFFEQYQTINKNFVNTGILQTR